MDLSKLTVKELEALQEKLDTEVITLNNQQMSIKILLNSLYGSLGNRWFRYFKLKTAEAITLYGQLAVRWADKAINDYLNSVLKTENCDYVVYGDTDSIYVTFDPLVKKLGIESKSETEITDILHKIGEEKIEKVLEKSYQDLADYMRAYHNKMKMEREVISPSAVFVAKKRYFMKVLDSEGVRFKEPKIKIMGIEAVKSSTPESCRDALKGIFDVILSKGEEETKEYVDEFRDKFKSLPVESVAFPRGVSDIAKWEDKNTLFKKGTPIHVRASLVFNEKLKESGLKHVQPINSGDKIKYCYMKLPNPVKQNVFAFPDYMPKEFKLEKYVDYDLQFEKTFMTVVEPIVETIGWSVDDSGSLEDFM